ncbi:MAG: helix-turn-helix domain-containing protein [Betaproteobacteria bacterium]
MNPRQIGAELRSQRKAQQMTLKDLAKKSGVHWVTLSKLENGVADLGLRKLVRVAQALGIELALQRPNAGYTLDDLAKGFLKEEVKESSEPHSKKAPLMWRIRS